MLQSMGSHCQTQPSDSTTKRISLVVQWLRIHLPMQGTWIPHLFGELRSHMDTREAHWPQPEILSVSIKFLCAEAKTRPSQTKDIKTC